MITMSFAELLAEPGLSQGERDALERRVGIMAQRGHAPMFARETVEDLANVERKTANEWAQAARDKYGIEVRAIRSNPIPNGVPDCFALQNGTTISLELTEVVDGALLNDIKKGKFSSAFAGQGFERSQWSGSRLAAYLIAAIEKKHAKYERNGERVDVLILHSDEPWLDPYNVENWLRWRLPRPRARIGSAYFLLTYHPHFSPNWPVFRLF